jgi:hypothetical protein
VLLRSVGSFQGPGRSTPLSRTRGRPRIWGRQAAVEGLRRRVLTMVAAVAAAAAVVQRAETCVGALPSLAAFSWAPSRSPAGRLVSNSILKRIHSLTVGGGEG